MKTIRHISKSPLNRRHFLSKSLLFSAGAMFQSLLPAWAQSGSDNARLPGSLVGNDLSLTVEQVKAAIAGNSAPTTEEVA